MTTQNEINDQTLIRGCVGNDKRSWNIFVERFSDLIYDSILRTFRRFGHKGDMDLCDDIHNDIFVRLLENRCRALKLFEGRNGCHLAHYLRTITVRRTIDFLRQLKPMVSIDGQYEESFFPESPSPVLLAGSASSTDFVADLIHQDDLDISLQLLADLKPRERRLCEMFFYEGKDSETVSKELGISIDYFYVAKQRAVSKLRKLAEEKKIVSGGHFQTSGRDALVRNKKC